MIDAAATNDHLAELESELERLSKSVDEIHAAQEAATEAVSASTSVLSTLEEVSRGYQELHGSDEELKHEIQGVLKEISNVDFPSRLDKLDNTVSAVSIGVQNLSTGIHDLSQKFEEMEKQLVFLHRSLMQQSRISFAIAALVVGGLIALWLHG